MTETIHVGAMSNEEFLQTYARAGRIGLAGGITLLDKMIARAQRHVDDAQRWSRWSHAFFIQGERADGCHWVIESDLDVHRKHVRLGVQENRINKFHDEGFYTTLAVLDFGLSSDQVAALLREGLELVATRCRYSVRELVGTLIALRHPNMRAARNPLQRDECFYCSAFVSHLFRQAGINLSPGLNVKNITPEDIAQTLVPHTMYVLERAAAHSAVVAIREKIQDRAKRKTKYIKGGVTRMLGNVRTLRHRAAP